MKPSGRAPRSPKAGRPPEDTVLPARVRRRRKTAHAAVRKDTTLYEAPAGPRVLRGRRTTRIPKR
jgi:hypothetical protein